MDQIFYKENVKYQLVKPYKIKTNIIGYSVNTKYIKLTVIGVLTIKAGYAWDGPSGPTYDSKDFMRGSLVHDALYQLMREKHLPKSERAYADELLKDICLADGMPEIRAFYVLAAVKTFGESFIDPAHERKILTAP